MTDPKLDYPKYVEAERRKIEAVFGPENPPVETRWWFAPLVWAIAIVTFPVFLAVHVLKRPKGGSGDGR